ncbi:Serine proteases trypsin domain, partial [Trinorchestia longiramus]
ASNPAAGVPWRWIPKHLTVTPNVNAIPYKKVIDSYVPKVRVPGTKAVEGCGPVPAQDRIVGGNEATPHSYPWMTALFIDSIYFCGGSIINEEWVLTAAHCMDGARTVDIVAGAHNIRENEPTQVTMTSTDFFVHEDYGSVLIRNDVALIRLPSPLTWTDAIKPICLPAYSDAELVDGDLVNPSGWGLPSDGK